MTALTSIEKLSIATAGAVFFTLGAMGVAQAQVITFGETVDAGQTLSTARNIPNGTATLNSIVGTISSPQDADLFRFFIQDPAAFSATTFGGAAFDTQLFLFDSNGFGVYGNDNALSGGARFGLTVQQSTLLQGSRFSPTSPGFYFLGISSYDNDPESANGEIFPDFVDFASFPPNIPVVFLSVDERITLGATGPGSGSPLTNFDGNGFSEGGYQIELTGVSTVPEPSSILGLLTFGALGAGAMLNRKRAKRQN